MDSEKIATDKVDSSKHEEGRTSGADSTEISDESDDVTAEDMAYWNEAYAKADAEMQEWWEANRKSHEAEEQLREELAAKARTKLEAALAVACEKDPDVAKLKGFDIIYVDGTGTISIGKDELMVEPQFVINTEHMALVVILRHEWMHHERNHGPRGTAFLDGLSKTENRKVWDWAFNAGADLEINSELKTDIEQAGLQDEACVPGHGTYRDWPPGLKAEDYARRIMATPDLRANMEQIAKTTVKWRDM